MHRKPGTPRRHSETKRPLPATSAYLRLAVVLLAGVLLTFAPHVLAHDIPADATVRVFVKPESGRLLLLLRMQMASIQEIDWPVRKADGALDLAAIEPFLRQAANKWMG